MSLHQLRLSDLLFLDIETVPLYAGFSELSQEAQDLWAHKTEYKRKAEEITPEAYYSHAGIWAEFGKIVCLSVGFFPSSGERRFRLKSFAGDEKNLLLAFKDLVENHFSNPEHRLCAHNGKEFDFPYIARRMLIHQIPLPDKLDLFGKKPWEVAHLDTMELWKFGDYKHYTSLKLLTHLFDIPSPKDDIDGSQVREVYYEEKNLERIATYCEKDVLAIAQLLLKFRQEDLLSDSEIIKIPFEEIP